jgi:hypothetical protein
MMAPARGNSQNSSSKYPTVEGFEASDVWTPNNNIVRNLNLDFNTVRLQTIIESIQRMVPPDSPLVALAQQGAEAAGNIIACTNYNWDQLCVMFIGNLQGMYEHPSTIEILKTIK